MTPTITETPLPPEGFVNVDRAHCRYGPGAAYLHEYGLLKGIPVEIQGRTDRGDWLYVLPLWFETGCWIKADLLEITGDISRTVVVAYLGDVAPGAQVEIGLNTVVLSDTAAGTVYANRATYTAVNLDPRQSNEVQVVVEGAAVLPVTGGLLDPRTPAGKMTWSAVILLAVSGWGLWRFQGGRS